MTNSPQELPVRYAEPPLRNKSGRGDRLVPSPSRHIDRIGEPVRAKKGSRVARAVSVLQLNAGTWTRARTFMDRLGLFVYFLGPRTASLAALATRNLTTVLAGILIFCWVFGLIPMRAFRFCFTSLPKPGSINSPSFLMAL
jgi:hypothetical protein